MTPTHTLATDIYTVPAKRATGGYIVVAAVHPVGEPPYVLAPRSDKRGRLAFILRSRRDDLGRVILTLPDGTDLTPLDPEHEVLWALPADLEVVPCMAQRTLS